MRLSALRSLLAVRFARSGLIVADLARPLSVARRCWPDGRRLDGAARLGHLQAESGRRRHGVLDAGGRAWFRLDEQRRDVPLRPDFHLPEGRGHRRRGSPLLPAIPGIDPIGLGRAVVLQPANATARRAAAPSPSSWRARCSCRTRKTYGRKAKEAALAVHARDLPQQDARSSQLYLNRVFLSGGVYGVETMSQKMLRKPASQLTLAEAALIAGIIRAPATVLALEPLRRRAPAQLRRAAAHARGREDHRGAGAGGARGADPHPAAAVRVERAARLRQGIPAAAVPQHLRRRQPARLEGPARRSSRRCRTPPKRPCATGCAGCGVPRPAGGARRDRSGDRQHPGDGRRVRLRRRRRSTAPCAAGASRARRSSRSSTPPRSSAGCRRCRRSRGLQQVAVAGARRASGSRATSERSGQDEMTLREALLESNNAAAVLLQQQVGTRPVLQLARDLGVPESAGRAVAGARQRAGDAARADRRLRGVPERRLPRAAARHRLGRERRRRRRSNTSHVERERILPEDVAFQMVTMLQDVVARGTGASARVATACAAPSAARPASTNDYRDAWFVGFNSSVVVGVWVGFDQPQTIREGGIRRARSRCRSGPTSCAARRAGCRREPFDAAGRPASRTSCACSRTSARWTAVRPTSSTSRTATTSRRSSVRCTREACKQGAATCGRRDCWARSARGHSRDLSVTD